MNKIISFLDFWSEQKTVIASGVFILAQVLEKYGYAIQVENLTDDILSSIAAIGVLYGLIIKIFKNFSK